MSWQWCCGTVGLLHDVYQFKESRSPGKQQVSIFMIYEYFMPLDSNTLAIQCLPAFAEGSSITSWLQ